MSATFSSQSSPNIDSLIVPGAEVRSQGITLLSGENRSRGAVLGRITLGAASSAAKSGGNTGNGTLVLDVTTPILANAQLGGAGVYTVRCIIAGTNAATFLVIDPKGVSLGTINFSGSGATVTFADRIKFVITDGSTDFVVGDGFDVTIAAGSDKYKLSASAAVDGSQTPDAVLAEDTDASSADVATVAYFGGAFNSGLVTLGTGHTVASVREGLRVKDIQLVDTLTTY